MIEGIGTDRASGSTTRSLDGLGREFHASTNGDRWRLLRDPTDARSLVRHTGNPVSGGHITDIALATFLIADRGGPEHQALWDLIGGLTEDNPTPPTAAA